jgi:hypothetical protein
LGDKAVLDQYIKPVLETLRKTKRYERLLNNIARSGFTDKSLIFEALFAYSFELRDLVLQYEEDANAENNECVDFALRTSTGKQFFFELVRPEPSQAIQKAWQKSNVLELSSRHEDPNFRTQRQTTRLQEKLRDKIGKFPEPHENIFSVIVVNCDNFHGGTFDDDHCRMVMYGRTRNWAYQEYDEGNRIEGILEPNNKRGNKDGTYADIRRKITSIIFVPSLSLYTSEFDEQYNLLDKSFLASNYHRSTNHLKDFRTTFRKLPVFEGVEEISPPSPTVPQNTES